MNVYKTFWRIGLRIMNGVGGGLNSRLYRFQEKGNNIVLYIIFTNSNTSF